MAELNANVPRAVREQKEIGEAAWRERYADDTTAITEDAAPGNDAENSAEQEHRDAPAPETQEMVDWEHRFKVLQGKYDSEVPRLAQEARQLREQLDAANSQLGDLKTELSTALANRPVDLSEHFSDEQREEFGDETLQLVHQHARQLAEESVSRVRDEFKGDLDHIRQTEQVEREQAFWERIEVSVPDWATINEQPGFHAWLSEPVVVHTDSGTERRPRQDVLAGYQQRLYARGVIDLFKAYKSANQERARQPSREMPGRSAAGQAADAEPVAAVTRADIKDFYRRKSRWSKADPEGCRAREREIERAVAEGRVRG